MLHTIFDMVVTGLLVTGLVFFCGTVIGILRFPDFYTRMHAAGKGDTLSSMLLLAGFAMHYVRDFTLAELLVAGKLMAIVAFVFVASPTATHALVDAGYSAGAHPWARQKEEEQDHVAP